MIKTIEINPDILARSLAIHLFNEFDNFAYIRTKFHMHDLSCDVDELTRIIKEYLNRE